MRIAAVLLACLLPLAGCATLVYPERRGQDCDRYEVDWPPAVVDGVLYLLGVVPGAVALGVDAGTGALWECSGGKRREAGDPSVCAPW